MLRSSLVANAAFSFCCGCLTILFIDWLKPHIPLPDFLYYMVALGLIGFSARLLWIQSKLERSLSKTPSIIAADIAWVIAATLLAAIFHSHLSHTGLLLLMATNLCVGLLALAQSLGLKIQRQANRYA